MIYKSFIGAALIFAVVYLSTTNWLVSSIFGFGMFYYFYTKELKVEKDMANMEVGL
jgi:hypothetical protein